jgi:Tfp pilus assembly protein PilV
MNRIGFHSARRGVTLMETVIGSLLVGGVLASTIQLVAPTVRATGLAQDKLTAAALADSLLDEIAALPFQDPTDASNVNGPEAGETTGARKEFDDIDDYHAWNAPAQQADGSDIVGLGTGWTVSVGVEHVRANNPGIIVATRTGVKRIVVAVSRDGVLLAERAILRTSAFDNARSGT